MQAQGEPEKGTEKDVTPPEFSVTVTPYEREDSNIRGLARIYFEDSFIVNNVNILQGKEKVFVAMPSYKTKQKDENGKDTLVKLVRNQAEMLVTAEKILKQKKEKCSGQNQPEVIIKRLQAEMKKLESSKIADYESYKAGKMEREAFTEKKALIDTRKQEILSATDEMEAKLLVEDEEQRQYQDAFEIKKYIHLEKYDKAVMAALILKAEVVDENRLNVVLSHTTPLKYEPVEVFMSGVDQSSVDKSTEEWLDHIEEKLSYQKWYCGHYHTEKKIDKLEIMFENFDEFCVGME